ncbi:unnamed protein product [Prorocentrum cordatum]|uniref:60S ribosomal protein L6 n=1 Tax=Prorocentrum cordatum TaxID=2364126 RepID=A0ABN9XRX9_9DINO|nr:unnamed protein product [Polarella glacialis]
MGKAGQARCVHRTFGKKTKVKSAGKAGKAATPPKLKKGLSPGSVLILLAGRFRGRRAVFLKQLGSGLLLVTGPYAVNGVPLRRVNQRFCIATSAKVDLKGADFSTVTDEYFTKDNDRKAKGMFSGDVEKKGISDEKKSGQKSMDDKVVKGLAADMKAYLKARFSLSDKMYPHELKF